MLQHKRPPAWLAPAMLAPVAVPLLWSLWHALQAGANAQAWQALLDDPQTWAAWLSSLWTGLASAALATAACAWLLSRHASQSLLHALVRRQGWMLAVPHAAFAMGLVLLVAPSGWLLRLLSPWATGLQSPPPWPTTQDPWGLGLVAVLVCKEVPFLLWAAGAHLLRPDVAQRLAQELQLAATLGYGPHTAWWRITWPQLLPRLTAPLLAVLAYSLTVVDVALVIGPATPPTLAVLAWQWLQDADPARNAQGAAAAWLLAATVALCAALAWAVLNAPAWRHWRTRGAPALRADLTSARPTTLDPRVGAGSGLGPAARTRSPLTVLLPLLYGGVLASLLLASFMGPWPFPALLPLQWNTAAWDTVRTASSTLGTTLWLALASAAAALVWATACLEWLPRRWLAPLHAVAYMPLVLPGVLWVLGVHHLALSWGLERSAVGLWLAHSLAAVPYVLLTLQGPYSGFDTRLYGVAATLGHSRWHFLLRIKWPLLRASLAAALAVGFAVSVAQYLPTLYVGAGRFSTVTTEAVTLAAGGQRNLMAAFAALQCLLPAAAFALAAWLGRGRRFRAVKDHAELGA